MTNYEKFKDVINESNGTFGVRKGVAKRCAIYDREISCQECDFDMTKDCYPQRLKWCAEEYHEPEPEKEEPEKKRVDGRVLKIAEFLTMPLLNALIDTDKDTATVALTAVMSGIIGSLELDLDEITEELNKMREIIERKREK